MLYEDEVIEKILRSLSKGDNPIDVSKKYKINVEDLKQIVKEKTGLSIEEYQVSKKIKRLMNTGHIDDAIVLAKEYPNCMKIQSKLIGLYIRKNMYYQAEEIAFKYKEDRVIQSQLMTIYLKQGRFKEAQLLALANENNPVLQSQYKNMRNRLETLSDRSEKKEYIDEETINKSKHITELLKKGNYDEAEEIAINNQKSPAIVSQLIRIYIEEERYKEALTLARKEEFKDNVMIQSQLITIYIRCGKYTEAKEISERFPDNVIIQTKIIRMLIKQYRYKEAEEIASRESLKGDKIIQSFLERVNFEKKLKLNTELGESHYLGRKADEIQISKKIKILIRAKEYAEASKLCNMEKYRNNSIIQSQLMTIYIREGKYEDAENLAKRFPNSESIQSQLMKMYNKLGRYADSELIGKREEFMNNSIVQTQLTIAYIRSGKYKEAKEIIEKFNLQLNPIIQSNMMVVYLNQGEYEQAEAIGRQEEFRFDPIMQSQLMTVYIREGKYTFARMIADRFKSDFKIQSQMVTAYIKKGDYDRAEEICKREEFKKDPIMQSQLMKLYVQEGRAQEAEFIGENEQFKNNLIILSQLMTIYIQEKEYDKAEELGKKDELINNAFIQSQLIRLYIEENRLDEAEEIAKKFPKDPIIQTQLITIYMSKKQREENGNFKISNFDESEKDKEDFIIDEILSKIEVNPNDEQIMEMLELIKVKISKIVLTTAISERCKQKQVAIQGIERILNNKEFSMNDLSILKSLMTRLQSKSNLYETSFYRDVLNKIKVNEKKKVEEASMIEKNKRKVNIEEER